MSHAELIVTAQRVVLVTGLTSILTWIGLYTAMAPWWRDPIGRTLVAKSALLACLFVHPILIVFFGLRGSVVAAWADVTLVGLVTPVMVWRIVVWVRERAGRGRVPGARGRRGGG